MKDQLTHWNNAHSQQWLHEHSATQTGYAEEVAAQLPAHASILELGCGEGNDSIYFAQQGYEVVATDFSDVVIEQNKARWSDDRLSFAVQDIGQPLAFETASFDAVYARLALHYFSDDTTKQIFNEIARVLKPGGQLHFMCKSTSDGLYGKGELLEADMYELKGHVRHFFSAEYAQRLLDEAGFVQTFIEAGEEKLYDRQSAFIKVVATK